MSDIGDTLRLAVTFRNSASAVADPTTVTLKIREPNGTETDYVYGTDIEVSRDSAGAYRFDLMLDASGDWYVRWIGTGAVATATEERIRVARSQFSDPL